MGFSKKHNEYFCAQGNDNECHSIAINTIPLQPLVAVLSDMLITEIKVKDNEIVAVTNTVDNDIYGNRE